MDRYSFSADFIERYGVKTITEIGVWRGEFAEQILRRCPSIDRYHLVDPWRHVADWDKPFNRGDREFEDVLAEARARTAPMRTSAYSCAAGRARSSFHRSISLTSTAITRCGGLRST